MELIEFFRRKFPKTVKSSKEFQTELQRHSGTVFVTMEVKKRINFDPVDMSDTGSLAAIFLNEYGLRIYGYAPGRRSICYWRNLLMATQCATAEEQRQTEIAHLNRAIAYISGLEEMIPFTRISLINPNGEIIQTTGSRLSLVTNK